MYYVLECFGPADQDRVGLGTVPRFSGINWNLGRRFKAPPPEPIQVTLDPESRGIMMPMFKRGIVLFRDDMIAILEDAGVNNLEQYKVIISNTQSGEQWSNYKAVNIVGTIACADLGLSDFAAPSGTALIDADFDSLVIDESKTRGQMMFRLAECVSAILIHEKIKQSLEKAAIEHLDFIEPENWVG